MIVQSVTELLTSAMELEKRDFRAMIYYDFKRGLKQEESHQLLVSTFEELAPSRATVFNWFA